jgi:putative aldouronate transport system permease protein
VYSKPLICMDVQLPGKPKARRSFRERNVDMQQKTNFQGIRTGMHRSEKLRSLKDDMVHNYDLYLMVIPGVIYYLLFKYWPMYGVQIAFRNYSPGLGIAGSPWVGLKYFEKFVTSFQFGRLMTNTFIISVYSLLVGFPIPILLALALNACENIRFKKTVQMVSYAPHFISVVVLVSMLNVFFGQSFGLVNNLLAALGKERILFLGKPQYFRHMYVWSGVWQHMGWNAIIYISALSGVSPELHEAATVEGATKLQRIRHIDIPHILPTAIILLIMNCGNLLSVGFDKVFLMQNDQNIRHAQVISTYVYEMGLLKNQTSYSTAIGLFNSVISLILLTTVNQISRKISDISLW